MLEIPYKELSGEALQGVLKEFVLREGTDYGSKEYSLEEKMQQVLRQLEDGKVSVVFDAETESVSIITARELSQLQAKVVGES